MVIEIVGFSLQAGTKFLVEHFAQPDLKHLDIRSDYDENVSVPDLGGKPVPPKYRDFIPYFPNWVTMPDFFRVRNLQSYFSPSVYQINLNIAMFTYNFIM